MGTYGNAAIVASLTYMSLFKLVLRVENDCGGGNCKKDTLGVILLFGKRLLHKFFWRVIYEEDRG